MCRIWNPPAGGFNLLEEGRIQGKTGSKVSKRRTKKIRVCTRNPEGNRADRINHESKKRRRKEN